MIRINLLPHREQKRIAKIRRFGVFAGIFALSGVFAVVAGFLWLSQGIDIQRERNTYLEGEISNLDRQLNEIETLKKERKSLLDRKEVVERLQANRAEAVKIMDQLIRQMPEGVYLKEAKQTDATLSLVGYAQSNARVATFMRALEDSPQFESPSLVEIKTTEQGGQRYGEFTLSVKVTRAIVEGGKQDSGSRNKKG